MKVELITNNEIRELRNKVSKTEYEQLVNKLHSSYNAIKIYARELKRKNNELTEAGEENIKLKDKLKSKETRIAFLNNEIERYKRMLIK